MSLPRSWQEKAAAAPQRQNLATRRWRLASRNRTVTWLEKNPLVWLAGRNLWLTSCALGVALASAGLSAVLYLRNGTNGFSLGLRLIPLPLAATLVLGAGALAKPLLVAPPSTWA